MKISVVKTAILPDHIGTIGLLVVSPRDIDAVNKWTDGESLQVDIKRPRNLLHHNKFMAILRMVEDNSETWTVDTLLSALKLELGYYTLIKNFKGIIYKIPMSISFESMEQSEFEVFYDKAIRILSEVSGIDIEAFEENWMDYV
jgi:hypothetical protein